MILRNREDIAKIINFGMYKVFTFNAGNSTVENIGNDKIIHYCNDNDSGRFATVLLKTKKRFIPIPTVLSRISSTRNIDKKNGLSDYFYLSATASVLKSNYSIDDYVSDALYARAPSIQNGDPCAILVIGENDPEDVYVYTCVASQLDPRCSSACYFIPESKETTLSKIKYL